MKSEAAMKVQDNNKKSLAEDGNEMIKPKRLKQKN